MKKRWAFVGAACLLAALFLVGVLAVGRTTQWFGLEVLAKGASPAWEYSYSTIWDPEVNSVDALDIGWGSGPVEVRAGQGAVITVTEYASRPLEEAEQLVVSASGGALKIRWDGSIVPLGLLQAWEKRLVVEVPQSLASQLDELRCRNFSGDVAVSGFWAQDIQVLARRQRVPAAGGEHFRCGGSHRDGFPSVQPGNRFRPGALPRGREGIFYGNRVCPHVGGAVFLPGRGRSALRHGGHLPFPAGEPWL